jgi:hypothetical protein
MSDSVIVNKLVDDILNGNAIAAKETFEDAISLKITNALDQRKMELAQQLYTHASEKEFQEVDEIETENEDE